MKESQPKLSIFAGDNKNPGDLKKGFSLNPNSFKNSKAIAEYLVYTFTGNREISVVVGNKKKLFKSADWLGKYRNCSFDLRYNAALQLTNEIAQWRREINSIHIEEIEANSFQADLTSEFTP